MARQPQPPEEPDPLALDLPPGNEQYLFERQWKKDRIEQQKRKKGIDKEKTVYQFEDVELDLAADEHLEKWSYKEVGDWIFNKPKKKPRRPQRARRKKKGTKP
jgi:hypothetical protein